MTFLGFFDGNTDSAVGSDKTTLTAGFEAAEVTVLQLTSRS